MNDWRPMVSDDFSLTLAVFLMQDVKVPSFFRSGENGFAGLSKIVIDKDLLCLLTLR